MKGRRRVAVLGGENQSKVEVELVEMERKRQQVRAYHSTVLNK